MKYIFKIFLSLILISLAGCVKHYKKKIHLYKTNEGYCYMFISTEDNYSTVYYTNTKSITNNLSTCTWNKSSVTKFNEEENIEEAEEIEIKVDQLPPDLQEEVENDAQSVSLIEDKSSDSSGDSGDDGGGDDD